MTFAGARVRAALPATMREARGRSRYGTAQRVAVGEPDDQRRHRDRRIDLAKATSRCHAAASVEKTCTIAANIVVRPASRFGGWRAFVHRSNSTPALVTPEMNVHLEFSGDLVARASIA